MLDYFSRWLQEKKRSLSDVHSATSRANNLSSEFDEVKHISNISSVERVLASIPAEIIARRAVECHSYARALLHLEQYNRQEKEKGAEIDDEVMYQQLLDIYSSIDEPDGIAGISAHLRILDPGQQALEDQKAGRWTAAQSWYDLSLAENPSDENLQYDLLCCLKESGRYGQ